MSDLQATILGALSVLQVHFTLYGFTFSFWDVLLWGAVASLLIAFLGGLFDG